ncbi:ion channel POLLUX [Phytophthora cinnamomi]|uniref:ion channel POLLUX n=1 Tax=Phytophthora cinnamomi TaxID=4785 RepID=UPI0035595F6E|nr:ion channel POLLUX [Phytophthora cinnamomi]
MGAASSLGKFLKSMDDEELSKLIDTAYKLEPQRMEKMFTLAKMRYYEELGQPPPRDVDTVDTSNALSMPAALLSAPQPVTSHAAPPMLSEMLPHTPSATIATASAVTAVPQVSTVTTIEVMADSADEHAPLAGVKDPMNALWTFEGHHLRELQAADKNPHNANNQALQQQGLTHTDHLGKNGGAIDPSTGAVTTIVQREVDADGYPVLYGSCGRDKRYGRCSVCYFRGLRCNTAHYCACCQRPVCVRPRKYPGEEHHKICWNVLHMDKDMIQRVEKKKKRKLQALTTAGTAAATVGVSASRLKTVGNVETGDGHDPLVEKLSTRKSKKAKSGKKHHPCC